MPFRINKVGSVWKIYKLDENRYATREFKTRAAAINMAKNWTLYRREHGYKIIEAKPDVYYFIPTGMV
jgi:hypothetical protein